MKTVFMLILLVAAGLVAAGFADNKPQEKPGKGATMPEPQKNLTNRHLCRRLFLVRRSGF